MDYGVCAAADPEEIEFVQSLEGCNCHSNGAGVQLGDPRVGLVTTLPYPVVLHANSKVLRDYTDPTKCALENDLAEHQFYFQGEKLMRGKIIFTMHMELGQCNAITFSIL